MRTNDFRLVVCRFLVSSLLFVLPVPTAAQDTGTTGSHAVLGPMRGCRPWGPLPRVGPMSGTLVDSSDHSVSGAAVTLPVRSTVETRALGTSERGDFVFRAVQPGTYAVSVELSGFRRSARSVRSRVTSLESIVL